MMASQVIHQDVDRTARARPMANQHDLIRGREILRNLLVKRCLFRNTLTAIVGLFSMDEVVMEIKRIIRSNRDSIVRTATVEIRVKVSGVVIDNDDYAVGLGWLGRVDVGAGLFQEPTQARHFVYTEFMVVRALEESSLRANYEGEFIASMRLRRAKVSNQLNRLIPAQIAWQLAGKQTLVQ